MNNILTAVFEDDKYCRVSGAWQYDYGQILRIQGLNLPTAVEIHFSLTEKTGESVTRIGTTKDGVTEVLIPDSMLEKETNQNYSIYAFIFLSDTTSGNTEYRIAIMVNTRPKPEVPGSPEEPEIFRETVEAVNRAADRSEKAIGATLKDVKSATTAANTAADSANTAAKAAQDQTAAAKKATDTLIAQTNHITFQIDRKDGGLNIVCTE